MLVRDVLGVCSFANVILDSESDPFFGSCLVYLKYQGTTDKRVFRRFSNCPVKEIFYDDMFVIKI